MNMILWQFKKCFACTIAFVVLAFSASAATPIRNIVLVHGAFVDGSGWQPVYEILTHDGYHVTLVQEPLTSLKDDVIATRRILDRQDGPVVLVAHSYGGTVITEAGTHPMVGALVYIAAHAPDVGETEAGNGKKYPNSSLADLYDPLTMPPDLVKAHNELDKAVDQCYRPQPFPSETKRIEFLFELYDKYTSGLFAGEGKKKGGKQK